ncbi:MAG: xylulokinase, partial [Clostridia bacterium]|nr:xylulokinase [Clostridia bacterium]
STHNDVRARGAFVGLSHSTTESQMSRAVMEGVAFALRDCLEVARSNGVSPSRTTLCGGGAKSLVWRKIIADALDLPVDILETEQGPSLGGAILAMVAACEYASVEDASRTIAKVASTVLPDPAEKPYYDEKYNKFRRLYPAIKGALTASEGE